jgi:hypothetical protein
VIEEMRQKITSETSVNALNMENKGRQKDRGKGSGNRGNSWRKLSHPLSFESIIVPYSLCSSVFPKQFFVDCSWQQGLLDLVPHSQDSLDPSTLVLVRRISF